MGGCLGYLPLRRPCWKVFKVDSLIHWLSETAVLPASKIRGRMSYVQIKSLVRASVAKLSFMIAISVR